MINEGYPLQFPMGWKRTQNPERAMFRNHTVAQAVNYLLDELNRLGGSNVIVSTNLMLRIDGLPYSNQKKPDDVGVAVYFNLEGEQQCFPCDRWDEVSHNIWAIYKSIQAIRGLSRWGAKEMVSSAFKGFRALPSPKDSIVMGVEYFSGIEDPEYLSLKYKSLAKKLHPDNKETGNQEQFQSMMEQYKQKKQSLGGQE